jgi:DNA-3-methyladenine glycosylase
MLNISAEAAGIGGGVLIRALEPLEGIAQMQVHRKTSELVDLTRGPGRLAAALRIDRSLDGVDVCAPGPLWLGVLVEAKSSLTRTLGKVSVDALAARRAALVIRKSTRIGIRRAAHRLLRFYERGSLFVSGPARLRS